MPILDVDKAEQVIVLKRSMSTGFAGIDNQLFYDDEDRDAVRRRQDLRQRRPRRGPRALRTCAHGGDPGRAPRGDRGADGAGHGVDGGRNYVIPDEIQRGMMETANPKLDEAGLRALRNDLKALL